jgi:DNA polymerase-3 subunit alpha
MNSGEREKRLFDLALRLEGLLRNCSKHAAGIVISPQPLTEDLPLWIDKDGAVVTQYTFTDVEAIGLIKFDFLGLKNLTLIANIVRLIQQSRGIAVKLDELPLDDAPTYKILQDGDTIGVFQAESGGMRRMLAQLRPSCFADVVAALALYRPGPLDSGMVDEFIKRKHGKEPIRYLHPALEPILRDTYGVIVYQEQVMQIAQALAGFSLGDADNLRRAMGKKKAEEMAKERERFLAGVAERKTADTRTAEGIFDQMETFAAYGFNKSHSAAYAVITYQTAYLKAHYRVEFLAGLLSLEAGDTDNTFKNIAECREQGIRVLAPDVNESREDFTVVGEAIRFGLGAVKGVGSKAIEAVIAAREEAGPFTSLHEFCLRVRGQVVNRKVLESLIACGAFDSIERNRARLWTALDDALRWAALRAEERTSPQLGLFAAARGGGADASPPPLPACEPWKADEELRHEREAIGFFITGHPLDRYLKDLRKFTNITVGTLRTRGAELPVVNERPGREGRPKVRIGGVINSIRLRNSKRGERYATFTLEDKEGTVEVIAWPDTYRKNEASLTAGEAVVISGGLDISPERCQIIAEEIMPLATARAEAIRQVHVNIDLARVGRDGLERLRETLTGYPGSCEAFLHLIRPDGSETIVAVPSSLRVAASDEVVEAVERVVGSGMLSFR